MRLTRLELLAFGPFIGKVLDFSGPERAGLHVIYGQNEAGKSTALRAVSALLFGVPERTEDAHRVPNSELCIAAELEHEEQRLFVRRLKRRKDSLRDKDDQPLTEASLLPFLHGVDRNLFHTLFGLDHERLRAGGQALLQGKAEVGYSLFDAGTGGRSITNLLAELEAERERLFKPKAQKPLLNQALTEYREAKRTLREAVRPPEKYAEQAGRLAEAKQKRAELVERLARLRAERERLKRILETLKPLAQRRDLKATLDALGSVEPISKSLAAERLRASDLLAQAEHDRTRLEREISRKQEQLAKLPLPASVLDLNPRTIAELAQRVGIHRKAAQDLPKIRGAIKQQRAEASRWLAQMGRTSDLEQAETLRLSSTTAARIRRLARQRQALAERCANLEAQLGQSKRELIAEEDRLQALPQADSHTELQAQLRRAEGVLDSLAEREHWQEAARSLQESVVALRQRLGLGDEVLSAADVPEFEALQTEQQKWSQLEALGTRMDAELSGCRDTLSTLKRRIQIIEGQGDVPSEEALLRARAERQELWRSLKLAQGQGQLVPDQLHAFEEKLSQTDDLSDRLRREAQRVLELAALRAEQTSLVERRSSLEARRAEHQHLVAAWQEHWVSSWKALPVPPRTPQEMLGWRQRFEELLRAEQTLREHQRNIQRMNALERLSAVALVQHVPQASPELALPLLVAEAAHRLSQLEQAQQRRIELSSKVDELRRQCRLRQTASEEAVRQAQAEEAGWLEAVAPLSLTGTPDPEDVLALVDEVEGFSRKLDHLGDNQRRVKGIERDARQFEADVAPLIELHAPDLKGVNVDDATEELVERYSLAKQAHKDRSRLEADLAALREELEDRRREQTQAAQELQRIFSQVGAEDVVAFEHLEDRARRAQALAKELAQLEDYLLEHGVGIDTMAREAEPWDRAGLVSASEALQQDCEDIEEHVRETDGEIRALQAGLEYYGDEAAAAAGQKMAERAASVRQLSRRYRVVHLARVILERQIAAHRDRFQGPVVQRASQLFRRLTLDGYRGLRVGLESEELICLRSGGEEVLVAGLSEGTQYQLYLALRLAMLEEYLKVGAPVPLVLDDPFIHFDEPRARAAFEVLGELAKQVQILYFSHLSRDLSLSRAVVAGDVLAQHQLSVEPALLERAASS